MCKMTIVILSLIENVNMGSKTTLRIVQEIFIYIQNINFLNSLDRWQSNWLFVWSIKMHTYILGICTKDFKASIFLFL